MPEALIWGASGGIGAALVRECKAGGWRVFAAARDETRIPAEADVSVSFNAGDPFTFKSAAMHIASESGGIDLAVYAAGGIVAGTIDGFSPADWKAVTDVNLTGAFYAAQESIHLLKEGGHFMVIGAITEKLALPRFGSYAAAKAALDPLITILSKEHRKLRFSLVRPGAVDTPFWSNVPLSLPKGAANPQTVAQAILARYQSGETGVLTL